MAARASKGVAPVLLPKSIRIAFRNLCSGIYLGVIDDIFEMEGFSPNLDANPSVSGQRRFLVEQYHDAIDWADPDAMRRLLRVYSRALRDHGRALGGDWWPDAQRLVRELEANYFRVSDDGAITPPDDFEGPAIALADYGNLRNPEVVEQYMRRMDAAISSDPDEAIGNAKELVESVCKCILDDATCEDPSKYRDLPSLYKAAAKVLDISTESVPTSAKGSAAAHQVLRSLATAVQGMSELRNELGTGHGQTRKSPATARHARLATGSARTLAVFLLDTWHARTGG